jgi:hypothetical protein
MKPANRLQEQKHADVYVYFCRLSSPALPVTKGAAGQLDIISSRNTFGPCLHLNTDHMVEPKFFAFENDFAENGIRCIPMIVRFKLDACGIKLKLSEWSRISAPDRETLVELPIATTQDLQHYREFLKELVLQKTGKEATELGEPATTAWSAKEEIPAGLKEKAGNLNVVISVEKWKSLTDLQRFSLLKLSESAHEQKNLPRAIKEFRLA